MTICGPNNQSLSRAQLYQYANQAGFQGAAADTIVAIALAESGGETGNCNLNDPYGGSFGVLQINGSHFLSGTTTKNCAFDPLCSFQFAYSLSGGGTNFNAWGTYNPQNGSTPAYLSYLTSGGAGSTSVPLASNSSTPPDPMSPQAIWSTLQGLASGLSTLYQWLTDPVRIIKMVVGVVLVGISVAVLFVPVPDKLQGYAETIRKAAHPIARTRKAVAPPPAKKPKAPKAPKKSSGGKPKP